MLRAFMVSGDARADSVFIIPGRFDAPVEAVAILNGIDVRVPTAPGEVLGTFGNGTGIFWTGHERSVEELEAAFRGLAGTHGGSPEAQRR